MAIYLDLDHYCFSFHLTFSWPLFYNFGQPFPIFRTKNAFVSSSLKLHLRIRENFLVSFFFPEWNPKIYFSDMKDQSFPIFTAKGMIEMWSTIPYNASLVDRVDIVVNPKHEEHVKSYLTCAGMTPTVVEKDLQKAIDQENQVESIGTRDSTGESHICTQIDNSSSRTLNPHFSYSRSPF